MSDELTQEGLDSNPDVKRASVAGLRTRPDETQPGLEIKAGKHFLLKLKQIPASARVVVAILGLGGGAAYTADSVPALVTQVWVARVDAHIEASDNWRHDFTLRSLRQWLWQAQTAKCPNSEDVACWDQREARRLRDEIDAVERRKR